MSEFEERLSVEIELGGEKIFGVLHLPKNKKTPSPIVLFCHGLAGNKVGKFRVYVDIATSLAKAGIASLRFDFRGSGDSEGAFSDCTLEGQIQDTLSFYSFIKQHYSSLLDFDRLGFFGRSFGGVISVVAASRLQCVKSLALWVPMFNADPWRPLWDKFLKEDLTLQEKMQLLTVEGQRAGSPFFEQFFKVKLEEALKEVANVPLLHIHGGCDAVISVYHKAKYEENRRFVSGKTTFLELPESDHNFSHLDERLYAIEETTAWFLKTL